MMATSVCLSVCPSSDLSYINTSCHALPPATRFLNARLLHTHR